RKTLKPTAPIVNVYFLNMTKYQLGFSAESLSVPVPPIPSSLTFSMLLLSQTLLCGKSRHIHFTPHILSLTVWPLSTPRPPKLGGRCFLSVSRSNQPYATPFIASLRSRTGF